MPLDPEAQATMKQMSALSAVNPFELRPALFREAFSKKPGLVFFHGGGFVLCDLDSHDITWRERPPARQALDGACAARKAAFEAPSE
jgi:acetyl esterase/lipase